MTEPTFWMVWNPAGGSPRQQHSSRLKAVAEAERLAALSPGQHFFVLEAVSVSSAIKPVTTVNLTNVTETRF